MTLLRIQDLLLIIELVFVGVDGVGEGEVLRVPQCACVLYRESRLLPVCGEWVYVWGSGCMSVGSGRMCVGRVVGICGGGDIPEITPEAVFYLSNSEVTCTIARSINSCTENC